MTPGALRRLGPIALALPALLLAGCESDDATGPRIVSITALTGLGQSGTVGAVLTSPLVVQAADQAGRPVEGVVIVWTVVSGGGVVTPSQTTTGADGKAQATFRLGSTLGTQSVQAELLGAQPALFTATASAAPVSQLAVAGGDNQTGVVKTTLPLKLAAKTTDAFGNAKAGITVVFTVTLGGGTLSSPSAVSDAAGVASVDWTLGTIAGTQRVTAAVGGGGIAPVTFNATAAAAAPGKVLIVAGSNQSAPPGARLPDSLVVRVTDQFDNPVADVTVAWTPLAGAGTVSPTSSKTDAGGRAATSWTLGATGGPKTVRAVAGTLPAVDFQAAGTIVFASAVAGGRHSCGLDEGGVAYCWGFNGDGELGLGAPAGGSGPVFATPQPTAVAGGLTFSSASAGGFHTCGSTLSFNPFCWGKDVDGRLGDGGNAAATAPAPVSGVNVFSTMSAGGTHSCALTPAGRLFCWGSNAEGQVGVVGGPAIPSDSVSFNTPLAVAAARTFRAVAAGGLHSCAVATGGAAWCWGFNASGQLGTGSTASATLPTLVSTASSFTSIASGGSHTCALDGAGLAFCWGANADGQLGDGTATSSTAPVAVMGGLAFASLSAGAAHTCGVTTAGVAFCWGRNASGQLGTGSTAGQTAPAAVGGGLGFASISAGERHTCGVTTGKVAYCWGDNQFGQLGDGTQVGRTIPAKVTFQP